MPDFGTYVRDRRSALNATDPSYSVRQVAKEIGVQPSFLSRVERGDAGVPSEQKIVALALVLGEDPAELLAKAGKVSTELQTIIRKRPLLFSRLLRELRDLPDPVLVRMIQEAQRLRNT